MRPLPSSASECCLVDGIFETAARYRSSPAVHCGDASLTYGELEHAVRVAVDSLPPNPTAPLVMSNDLTSVVALLARLAAGLAVTLLPPGLLPGEQAALPATLPERIAGSAYLAQLTSGSTGPSRLSLRSMAGIRQEIEAVRGPLGTTPEDRVLCTSSLAHSYALVGGLLTTLLAGGEVIVTRNAVEAVRVIECHEPTIIFGLAGTYEELVRGQHLEFRPRWALSAGAALPRGLFEAVRDRLDIEVRQDYGTTETGTIALDTGPRAAPETVGIPLPHLELSPQLERGDAEIMVRGDAVGATYLPPSGFEPLRDENGWFHTGDRGRRLRSGALQLTGRIRPHLQIGSQLLPAEALERLAHQVGRVDEAIALADPNAEPLLIRLIVTGSNIDFAALDAACRKLAGPDCAVQIEAVPQLPRSPAGKVLQKYLL